MAAVTLDPRFGRVLDLPVEVEEEEELAGRIAAIGGFNKPTRPETVAVLVPFALRVQELLSWEGPIDVTAMAGAHGVGPEFLDEFTRLELVIAATDLDGLDGKLTYPPDHVSSERSSSSTSSTR